MKYDFFGGVGEYKWPRLVLKIKVNAEQRAWKSGDLLLKMVVWCVDV